MSLISTTQKLVESKRLQRWVTVLEADEVINEPRLEFLIGILSDKKMLALAKPYERKGSLTNMTQSETIEFRKTIIGNIVHGWRGMTTGNARRLCMILLEHPDLISPVTPSEWPFDPDDLQFFAENMSGAIFGELLSASLDMEAYAREAMLEAKKKFERSSDSPQHPTPPSSADATDQES